MRPLAPGFGLVVHDAISDAEQDAKTHFKTGTGTGMDRVRALAAVAAEDRADIVIAAAQEAG